MASMVSNVELSGEQPKRIVMKLTEQEKVDTLILSRHKNNFCDTLIQIRLIPFIKDPEFHNGSWDILMTWLSEECNYKHSRYYGNHYEDFVFTKDDDDYYIQTPTSTESYKVRNESEMDAICDEYIRENIYIINHYTLYDNLTDDAMRSVIQPKNMKPSNAVIYESSNCPVCLCDFVETENESDFLYKKATKQLENGDDRVVRIEPCCGHLLCVDCYNNILKRGNQKCPTCRVGLDCWDENSDDEYEDEEYTIEDIEELCYQEDATTLLKIVDLVELRKYVLRYDGYEGLVGAERIWEIGDYGGIYVCLN